MGKLIFVVGTGRSGTHLIGRTISSHPEINGRIEVATTFNLVTSIASQQDWNRSLILTIKKILLVSIYKLLMVFTRHQYVLEKSHPSIWLVDFLTRWLKDVYFIAVWRDVAPTVASMLKHKGVLAWYDKLPLDRPNRFLGIDSSNMDLFKNLTIEEKCSYRWLAHRKEINRLENLYPTRFLSINYDDFILNNAKALNKLAEFLEVENLFVSESFKLESLTKWEDSLDTVQIDKIMKVVSSSLK